MNDNQPYINPSDLKRAIEDYWAAKRESKDFVSVSNAYLARREEGYIN